MAERETAERETPEHALASTRDDACRDAQGAPCSGTVERWAYDYIRTTSLREKLAPPPVPTTWTQGFAPLRLDAPGRPSALEVAPKGAKTPKPGGLRAPRARAMLLHTFLHHELQAAELMAWAVLAFPATPLAFRRGLLAIALDEARHATQYGEHIAKLGFAVGDFPVRDWFWERVPGCATPLAFVSCMGLGFEGGNLEHTRTFAARFRAVGDEEGAALQERIGREEIAHVRFGRRWFDRFGPPLTFERWCDALPPPLSPMLLRGKPLHRAARRRAGLDESFLDALEHWAPEHWEPDPA